MIVRDKTKKKTEYGGRDTTAVDELCPCRSCYHPHNVANAGDTPRMVCLTNYHHGCPTPKPLPEHVPGGAQGKSTRCCRCGRGVKITLSYADQALEASKNK